MKFRFDNEVHALYVEVRPGAVARTVELSDGVYADLNKKGEVLGLEFLNADDFAKFIGAQQTADHEFVQLEDLTARQLAEA